MSRGAHLRQPANWSIRRHVPQEIERLRVCVSQLTEPRHAEASSTLRHRGRLVARSQAAAASAGCPADFAHDSSSTSSTSALLWAALCKGVSPRAAAAVGEAPWSRSSCASGTEPLRQHESMHMQQALEAAAQHACPECEGSCGVGSSSSPAVRDRRLVQGCLAKAVCGIRICACVKSRGCPARVALGWHSDGTRAHSGACTRVAIITCVQQLPREALVLLLHG